MTRSVVVVAVLTVFGGAAGSAVAAQSTVAGANPAAIQPGVDGLRTAIGGANNGVGGTFGTGRREVNWDATPDAFAAPNTLPGNFFNSNSARGIVFTATGGLAASADSSNPTVTPVRFGNLAASYPTQFITFTAERLMAAPQTTTLDVAFFVPGTTTPATVKGFGAVFTDVDGAGTRIQACDAAGRIVETVEIPAQNLGLSFGEIHFDSPTIARVRIHAGNVPLSPAVSSDGAATDAVALDDVIYGEPAPRAAPPAPCGAADLETTVSVSPSTATVGDTLTAITTVRNTGQAAATGVQVTVATPSDASANSTVAGASACQAGQCVAGDLAPGASAVVVTTYQARQAGVHPITVTASTPSQQTSTSNDSASAQVTVAAAPPPPVVVPKAQAVVIDRAATRLLRGRIPLIVACPLGTTTACRGKATVRAGTRILGTVAYRLTAGTVGRVKVPLNAAGRRHFVTRSRSTLRVTITNAGAGVTTATTSTTVVVRR